MPKTNALDRISFSIFLAVLFLLPFFSLTFVNFSLPVGKGMLISAGVISSAIFWLVARLVEGRVSIPRSRLFLFGLVFAFSVLLSALFSSYRSASFLGSGFEVGTFGSVFLGVVAMFLAASFFQDKKNIFKAFLALGASFLVVSAALAANLVAGPGFFGKFLPANLLGSWNDVAIFSGLMAAFSLLSFEFLILSRVWKAAFSVLLALSLFILALASYNAAWLAFGALALLIFIHAFISRQKDKKRANFPVLPFAVVIISLFFAIAGNFVSDPLSRALKVSNTEIRPSFSATFEVAKGALTQDPVLGSGPNLFSAAWSEFKPSSVSRTIFWDAFFSSGSGLVPTFAVTSGLLGFLSFLLFLGALFWAGLKSLGHNALMDFGSPAVSLTVIFLWLFSFIYAPGQVIFFLSFVFSGILIGVSCAEKKIKPFEISFLKDPRLSFFSILILTAAIALFALLGYGYVKKFVSIAYFQKAAFSENTLEGIARAESYLSRSISLDRKNDLYYRSLAQAYLSRMAFLLRQGEPAEDTQDRIQQALSSAEGAARLSADINPLGYLNWLSLASVYEEIIPLNVSGAREGAQAALAKALALNPANPAIYLRLARVAAGAGDLSSAENYLMRALELRPNDKDIIRAVSELKSISSAPSQPEE